MSKSEETKLKILKAGLICWPDISARKVGEQCGMTHTAILHHFSGEGTLKNAIAEHAVEVEDLRVVRLLICNDHPSILHLPPLDRAEYFSDI